MRKILLHFAAFSVLLAIGGFLVTLTGVVPIKASSGHFKVTKWFLDFAKERSVSTHAWQIEPPPLEDRRLIIRGAGVYESNCRNCHGSPSLEYPSVARRATPPPPYLPDVVPRWKSRELFYIVKHGIKLTAMPAWPSQKRDDEVWPVVAFLRALPNLDAKEYQTLVEGNAAPEKNCHRCHGKDGLGRDGLFPRLAGQSAEYIERALRAYKKDDRHSGVMGPISAELKPEDMRELALYYSSLAPAGQTSVIGDTLAIGRGQDIAQYGVPAQRVPSCEDCHGPGGPKRNAAYPRLAGQNAEYLALQLRLFRENRRGGSEYAHLMRAVAERLTEEQIKDAALYYGTASLR